MPDSGLPFSCHNSNVRILISAGEASGEFYGAELIKALRQQIAAQGVRGATEAALVPAGAAQQATSNASSQESTSRLGDIAPSALAGRNPASTSPPNNTIDFFGVGGDQMRAAGCDLLVDAREIAEVGIVEVIKHIPTIYRRFRQVVHEAERRRPDAAVLIDFPDFNLRLARELHKLGVPVIYYVSPQLWAWKQRRIERVRQYVREILVIFPFEEKFYREHDIAAKFVGHPLADLPAPATSREEFAREYQLDPQRPWIALLPGSRRGEVSRIFPVLLEAAQLLGPEYVYTVPVASTLSRDWVATFLRGYSGPPITFTRDARATLLHARAAAVTSGTSTLEASLIGTPFTMVYRVAPLTWALGRRLVKVDRFAMVNLIAARDVVPELVQDEFTPQRVCEELRRIIPEGADRDRMLSGFRDVRERLATSELGANASERAARAVLEIVRQSN
jgi:lipid-A-disaccharide synthase